MRWTTRRRAFIFGMIVLTVFGVWRWRSNKAGKTEVRTYIVTKGDVREVIVASGEIKAEKTASLKFPATGKLAFNKVVEGDTVKKWQLLMGMDTTDLSSAETEAYYKYLAADAYAKKIEDSVKGHDSDETFVQKNDRVAAQTARDIAYDNWREAQRDARDAILVAPLAGVVTQISVSAVGATVTGTDGVTIVDPGTLYFASEVDEADVGKVVVGQEAEVSLDAHPDRVFAGKVDRISFASAVSDSGATVYLVRIRLEASELGRLRMGMNGDAKIVLMEVKNVLTLPLEAVVGGGVTLESGEKRKVEIGIEGEETMEIKSGLGENERVIIK